ncbi:unnamed protein product [Dovyalis caffra]|uniref:Uncharacterized protein n=1 Tax=Dovyalis caffra TaxID=77055 RepID=A0AAV1QZ65_9ROSI|nr:unnamed protein product [Dovyalis caffra]
MASPGLGYMATLFYYLKGKNKLILTAPISLLNWRICPKEQIGKCHGVLTKWEYNALQRKVMLLRHSNTLKAPNGQVEIRGEILAEYS